MPKGFTLVELLIDLFIFSAIALAIFSSMVFLQRSINLARLKIQAMELTNKQMEILRNMSYDSLSTQNGTIYPPGNIVDNQTVNVGNTSFNVQTIIQYVDDPYDGNAAGTITGKPKDLYSYDYKKVEVRVTTSQDSTVLADIATNFSAKAAETPTNTGILSLKVINSQGQPFANAQITVSNPNPNPPVNIQTFTDSLGIVVIPMLPPDNQNRYHIIATAPNNSTDSTNPITQQLKYPIQPDVNILAQQITNQTLSIDALANLNLTVKNNLDNVLANVPITITSNKITYNNPTVYKYQQTFNSTTDGSVNIPSIEWDSYGLTSGNGYIISSISPYGPIPLAPASTTNTTVYVTNSTTAPTLSNTNPLSDDNSGPTTLAFLGTNFSLSGATAVLSFESTPTPTPTPTGTTTPIPTPTIIYSITNIIASSISVTSDKKQMTVTFDLTNKQPGSWQIKITNQNGEFVKQPAGFTITTP